MEEIKGFTLRERAQLVLLTLGKTPAEIQRAYRRRAKRYHPDMRGGNAEKFQVINEAYELLAKGHIPKRPLLANDELLAKVIGKRLALLIDRQKEWEEYDRWMKDRFYGVGVL
ncbi:MAG: DnaJ domain-containing protein [Lentisphaerae bacterium]|nr:DnaJ domain-containing protein [Lentisphaerota bacterium]